MKLVSDKGKLVEHAGQQYVCEPVMSGKPQRQVGFAPTPLANDLDELLDLRTAEQVFELAWRQWKQDCKNRVRAKATKDKASASGVVAAINAGQVTAEAIGEVMKEKHVGFTEAGNLLLGIGDPSKLDPEFIHYDVCQ